MSESVVIDAPIHELQRSSAAPAARESDRALRILFLVSAHNGLSQRAWIALTELGHEVEVAVVDSAAEMEAAVSEHDPELIVCPFLKTFIPETIWHRRACLVLHPGPPGDRGPSSLDWAIELGAVEWGVTALLANGEFDAGEVVATRSFRMREAGKSSLYRHEVRHAAIEALQDAVGKIIAGRGAAGDQRTDATPIGRARPLMSQHVREIDWHADPTDTIIRKVRAGEGHPGVLDVIAGCAFHLFGVFPERNLHGGPGEIVAQRNGAVCRATTDGAVWITHLRQRDTPTQCYFKLPATLALELAGIELTAPVIDAAPDARLPAGDTYREITYEADAGVGYLRFDFYNGAMSTDQCLRLREAYAHARAQRDTRVIVLLGGDDYFSNGIHLNVIEASEDPGAESWRNLNAINDVVRDILETDSHLVMSALAGDAAAGGVPLALAADYAVAREDVVLNPYYAHMGGLYGSEYWTYLLPRRIGATITTHLTQPPFNPIGARRAVRIGVLDATFGADLGEFRAHTRRLAHRVANDGLQRARLDDKRRRRAQDERTKPLQAYRTEELARCLECFFGRDRSYHDARRRFVYKLPAAETILRQAA
jgi:putative two-component system protein, hydrogenase maturation factor HypX/HoxX